MLAVVWVGAFIRVAITAMFPNLGVFLDNRVEVTTPVSSFKRLSECVYLYENSIPPYEGDMCYHSPLLLAFFNVIGGHRLVLNLIYAAIDAFAAQKLADICTARPKHSVSPDTAALIYMLNPFTMAASLAKSSTAITNCTVLTCLSAAQTGNPAQAMILLALGTALGWYPMFYIIPVLILANRNTWRHFQLWRLLTIFLGALALLGGLSYIPVQSLDFIKVYKAQLLFTDMTRPNLGLWWYFFIEMFAVFRPFFLGMFQLLIGSFSIPLSIRFPDDPLFVATVTAGVLTIFKPYPEASDMGLFLSLLGLNAPVLNLMKFRGAVALGLLYTSALAPTFHHLWIYVGSGNANFFYAITLVYSLTLALCVCDMLWAAIRLDYDGGRATNLMQI